ncbi:hypothetical protein CTI12_AA468310 [Artemisia annua]|uniref:Uncharacterized protein n=1 Tax=Artemisia annua TaxID=35608 RepID=A0A2U1LPF5_ARTAN|nr:hypothetical protein CTI12_AA468310 [Artemisia annua]
MYGHPPSPYDPTGPAVPQHVADSVPSTLSTFNLGPRTYGNISPSPRLQPEVTARARDHSREPETTAETGCPSPTIDFQVFRSLCKKYGKETIIRLGLPEMKKVIWYVLHNSPEIDAYMNEFQSERPESDMQQEFPRWFESKIGNLYTANDPRCTPDLFALACGPSSTATSVNSCVVNGVKFVVHSRDVKRTTQNSGICSPGEKPGEMYYGQLELSGST